MVRSQRRPCQRLRRFFQPVESITIRNRTITHFRIVRLVTITVRRFTFRRVRRLHTQIERNQGFFTNIIRNRRMYLRALLQPTNIIRRIMNITLLNTTSRCFRSFIVLSGRNTATLLIMLTRRLKRKRTGRITRTTRIVRANKSLDVLSFARRTLTSSYSTHGVKRLRFLHLPLALSLSARVLLGLRLQLLFCKHVRQMYAISIRWGWVHAEGIQFSL